MAHYDIVDQLNELEKIVFDNNYIFIDMFCKGDVYMLVDVFFGSNGIYIHYIMDSGQHISDVITIEEFERFLKIIQIRNDTINEKEANL